MRNLILLSVIILIILMACSGRDKITVDKIPPLKPVLIPHLGDLPDSLVINNNQTIHLTDENNGIDTVPDGDWIRVSWEHFLDSDLDYVKIFRYDEFNPTPVLIDSISSSNDYYLDSKNTLSTYVRFSYFVEVVDNAGNTAFSDTVSYKLLSKQILVSPNNNATALSDSIKFEWNKSGFPTKLRLLVFDDNHDVLYLKDENGIPLRPWFYDINVAFEGYFFEVTDPADIYNVKLSQVLQNYTCDYIYWRVDAFDWDSELEIFIGSESYERLLYLSSKK